MTIAEKLTTIAENEQKVYEAGRTLGIEEGKKAKCDAFWDVYQRNGTLKNCSYLFAGMGWNPDCFYPKHNITPSYCDYFFGGAGSLTIDLVERLKECGVVLDTSNAKSVASMFSSSGVLRIGEISTISAGSLTNIFAGTSNLVTIEKLILKSDGTQTFNNAFNNATALENITIEGVIGNNINFSACTKLSKVSITSIMQALSTTATGKTLTLSQAAVESAFVPEDVDGWVALCNARSNWTISMV